MLNIQIETITTTNRTGLPIVLITALWRGHVIEVDTYRASDMAQMETLTLKSKEA